MTGRRFFEFGRFRLDCSGRMLFRAGHAVPLPPKAADTLLLLLENAGHVVDKQEMLDKVWHDAVVEEGSLTRTISVLRKALEDGVDEEEYISTISKRGYRFAASVRVVYQTNGHTAENPAVADERTARAPAKPRQSLGVGVMIVAAAALLTAILVIFNVGGWRDRLFPAASTSGIRSLAVLPLENLSKDPEQEYFADGITEALITDLAKISSLRVVSRTSIMQYKGVHKPLSQIADELGVDAVVEGTVLRSGNRARISAQLVRARNEQHLWAEMYDRELDDALRLQGQVAQAIADQIQIRLTPGEREQLAGRRRVDAEAYELYLKGRYYWNKRDAGSEKKSLDYFQRAIAKDPEFALAYVGLADTYNVLPDSVPISSREALSKSKAASEKALQLDDRLAEAHASRALVLFQLDWDWPAAESEFRRAIELNPGYATGHHWYSLYLSAMGRCDEAIREAQRARELDPLSLIIQLDIGATLFFCHQLDAAFEADRRVLEMAPEYSKAHLYIATLYATKGMLPEGLKELHRGIDLAGGGIQPMREFEAWLYAASGKPQDAQRIIGELERSSGQAYLEFYTIAATYAALGNRDAAFAALEKAYRDHTHWIVYVKVDPRMGPLHDDPRFRDLLRRMKLG